MLYATLAPILLSTLTCHNIKDIYQDSDCCESGANKQTCLYAKEHPRIYNREEFMTKSQSHFDNITTNLQPAPLTFTLPESGQNGSSLFHSNGFPSQFTIPWTAMVAHCKGDTEPAFVTSGQYKTRTGEMKTATLDTPFNIASLSEIIQHFGLVKLWEQGKLYADETIAEVLPHFTNVTHAKVIRTGDFVQDIQDHPERYGTVHGPFTKELCFHDYLNVWAEASKAAVPNVCKTETYYLEDTVLPTMRDISSFSTGTLGWWRPIFDPFVLTAMTDTNKKWPMSLSHELLKMHFSQRTAVFQSGVMERAEQNLGYDNQKTLYLSHVPGRTWSYNEMPTITAIFYEMGAKDVGFQKYFEDLFMRDVGMTSTYISSDSLSQTEIDAINDEIPLRARFDPASPHGWVWDEATATDSAWMLYPDAMAPMNLEGYIKSNLRDLMALGNTIANFGWSPKTKKRVLSKSLVKESQKRKSLGIHEVERLADDYFKPRENSGYFSEFVVDTTDIGYIRERYKWENPYVMKNKRSTGATTRNLAVTTEDGGGWYGLWGQWMAWEMDTRCIGIGTSSISYNTLAQTLLRDIGYNIFLNSMEESPDWV